MIQVFFNGMITLLLAKFALNDMPHAVGLGLSSTSAKVRLVPDFFRRVYDSYYEPFTQRPRTTESIEKDLVPWATQTDIGYIVQFPYVAPPRPRLWYHGCEVGNIPDIMKVGLSPPVSVRQDPVVATFFGFLRSWGTWSAIVAIDPAYVSSIEEDEWYEDKAAKIIIGDPVDSNALGFFTSQQVNMFYGKLWKTQSMLPPEAIREIWVELEEHKPVLLANPNIERKPTPGQLRYIAVLCQQLKMTVVYEERVRTFGEAGLMIRELEAERKYRRKLQK